MIYKDLRDFIKQVEKLGALRHVEDVDAHIELGGITEVAAGLPECPALLFDKIKGYAPGFRVLYQCYDQPAKGRPGPRHRSNAGAAGRTQGLEGEAAIDRAARTLEGK